MSSVIRRNIVCDGCGDPFEEATIDYTIKEIREHAKKSGWIRKGNMDFCEECRIEAYSRTIKELKGG